MSMLEQLLARLAPDDPLVDVLNRYDLTADGCMPYTGPERIRHDGARHRIRTLIYRLATGTAALRIIQTCKCHVACLNPRHMRLDREAEMPELTEAILQVYYPGASATRVPPTSVLMRVPKTDH